MFGFVTLGNAVKLLLLLLITHYVSKIIIYLAFGLKLGHFNLFDFSLRNLEVSDELIILSIDKIQFRIFFFSPYKKFFTITTSDLQVTLKNNQINTKEIDTNDLKRRDSATKYEFRSDDPIHLYPENHKLKRLIRLLLGSFPSVALIFNGITLCKETGPTIKIKNVNLVTDVALRSKKTPNLNISTDKLATSFGYWFTDFKIGETIIQDQIESKGFTSYFQSAALQVGFTINLKKGTISNFNTNIKLHSARLSFLSLFRISDQMQAMKTQKNPMNLERKPSDFPLIDNHSTRKNLYMASFIYKLLNESNIVIDDFKVSDIPILTIDEIFKVSQTGDISNDTLMVHFRVKSLGFNLSMIKENQAGYDFSFTKNDNPIQAILSLMHTSVTLDLNQCKGYSGTLKVIEILSIPNLSVQVNSSLLFNLIRLILAKEDVDLQKALVQIHVSCAGMILDLTTEQLCLLVSKFIIIYHDNKLKKLTKKAQTQTQEEQTPTRSPFDSTPFKIFIKLLPLLSIKLLIERPTVLLKKFQNGDLHLLTCNPSMLNVELNSAKKEERYSIISGIDWPNINIDYIRKNQEIHENLIMLRDARIDTILQIVPELSFKGQANINSLEVNLTNLEMLNGVSILIMDIVEGISVEKPPHLVDLINEQSKTQLQKSEDFIALFNYLPGWFQGLSIHVRDVFLKIGSRSIFMPSDLMTKESSIVEDGQDDDIENNPRYIIYKLATADVTLNNEYSSSLIDELDETGSSHFSSSTIKSDDYYWRVKTLFTKLSAKAYYGTIDQESGYKLHPYRLLNIPTLLFDVYSLKDYPKLYLSLASQSIRLDYSPTTHFILFSSLYLLKNTLFKPLTLLSKKKKAEKTEKSDGLKILDLLQINCLFTDAIFFFTLPDDIKVRLDFHRTSIQIIDAPILIARAMLVNLNVESPKVKDHWERLLSLQSTVVEINLITIKEKDPNKLGLAMRNNYIKINIPNQFIIYKLFDSIALSIKYSKQMLFTLKTNSSKIGIMPSAKKPDILPTMSFKSKRVNFSLEDDPFEVQLSMIYQLNRVEQRLRTAKEKEFALYLDELIGSVSDPTFKQSVTDIKNNPSGFMSFDNSLLKDIERKLYKIRSNISKSWIYLVNDYNLKKNKTIQENAKFLNGIESYLKESEVSGAGNLLENSMDAPLMSLILENLDLGLKTPTFEKDGDLPHYVNRVSNGIPLDTNYTLNVPMHVNFKVSELRAHLRDTPIPLAYIPRSSTYSKSPTPALELSGIVVILEQLWEGEDHTRWQYLPFVPDCIENVNDKFFSLTIPKTLATVRTLVELSADVTTDQPVSAVSGTCISPIFRQLSINMDDFSKPKMDPSPKLGIWDTVRNLMYGHCTLNWKHPESELRVTIKNSTDPYEVFGKAAGYTLVFKNNVKFSINDPNASDLLVVDAKEVVFGTLNLVSTRLPVWCSKKLAFLPIRKEAFVSNSLYGYYLDKEFFEFDDWKVIDSVAAHQFKKINIRLIGDIQFKLGFLLERKLTDGSKTSDFKPNYEVELKHPNFIDNNDTYDAYAGFRSSIIHMAISLHARGSDSNSIYLTPKSMEHFLFWFKQFGSGVSLPIRDGQLFNSAKDSVKFSKHLQTMKMQFSVSPLYLFHGYRLDLNNPNDNGIVGLKGRISSFTVDLHQRKEHMIKKNHVLDREVELMKMKFNLGEVQVEDIDLRAVESKFDLNSDLDPVFNVFDDDQEWFDLDDFDEIDLPSVDGCYSESKMLPLLYSPKFSYRIHNSSKSDLDNEGSHDCIISKETFHMDSIFTNLFSIDRMLLKWNCEARNLIFRYIRELEFRRTYTVYSQFSALQGIENKSSNKNGHSRTPSVQQSSNSPIFEKRQKLTVETFETDIREIDSKFKDLVACNDYLVQFVDPQIQLIVSDGSESMILMKTPEISLNVLSIKKQNLLNSVNDQPTETRFASVLTDTDLFVFYKDDVSNVSHDSYGSTNKWPIFLSDDGNQDLDSYKILSKTSIIVFYKKLGALINDQENRNKLTVQVGSFETTVNSKQYFSFYSLVINLILYSEPQAKRFDELLKKLVLATDFSNLDQVFTRIREILDNLGYLDIAQEDLNLNRYNFSGATDIDSKLRSVHNELMYELYTLLRVLVSGVDEAFSQQSDSYDLEWFIGADALKVNMMVDDNEFLQLLVNDGIFKRIETSDGSTLNSITIAAVKCLNLDTDILFPELLSRYDDSTATTKEQRLEGSLADKMIEISWTMNQPVGGIRIIESFDVLCSPLKINVEEKTGKKLMDFIFPDGKSPTETQNLIQADGKPFTNGSSSIISGSHDDDEDDDDGSDEYDSEDSGDDDSASVLEDRLSVWNNDLNPTENEMNIMMDRASNYFNFSNLKINDLRLCISLYARGKLRLVNVRDFVLNLPMLQIQNKIWKVVDLVNHLKKYIIKSLLNHSGRLIRNKFKIRRRIRKNVNTKK